jgi:hypothetical protein
MRERACCKMIDEFPQKIFYLSDVLRVQDPDDKFDSDCSANDDEETDTDIENAGCSRDEEMEDRVLAGPSHTVSSTVSNPSVCHPPDAGGASCCYNAATYPDQGLPCNVSSQLPISDGFSASPMNLKIVPVHSGAFHSGPPLEQLSRVVHQNFGMATDEISDSVLPARPNSASLNAGEVLLQPPLPAVARPSHQPS